MANIVSALGKASRWYAEMVPRKLEEKHDFYLRLLSVASMILTFFLYVWTSERIILGVGIPLMWLCHESGHVYACSRHEVRVSWVFFLPGVGVLMRADETDLQDPEVAASVALAGPISGFMFSIIGYVFWSFFDGSGVITPATSLEIQNVLMISAAYNLFQLLITTPPFDGGVVMQLVHWSFRYIGCAVLIALGVWLEKTWVISLFILALTYWRFTIAWRRLLVISVLALLLIFGIYLGYGRDQLWANLSDLFVIILALRWSIDQVRKDNKPFHVLFEWRVVSKLHKKVSGKWVPREDGKRRGERSDDGRRLASGLVVPKALLPERQLPPETKERRGSRVTYNKFTWFTNWGGAVSMLVLLMFWITH
jgi:hypothetical protein